jgi:hypothetical protein
VIRLRVRGALFLPRSHRVDVVPLYADRYRVNVRSPDARHADVCVIDTTRITHSFFVVADDRGEVLSSDPPLLR